VEVTETSISGPLPSLPGNAPTELTVLRITNNRKLLGTLPPSWSSAASLAFVDLSNNAITGTVPDAWANFQNVQQINLAGNKLTGSITKAWVKPNDALLTALNVSGNTGMKGCLADVKSAAGESLPFIDARRTSLLDCLKSKPALTKWNAPQAGWLPAACDKDGYSFKAQQLPSDSQQFRLYALPSSSDSSSVVPLATIAETQAACDASADCVMFTSDGSWLASTKKAMHLNQSWTLGAQNLQNSKALGSRGQHGARWTTVQASAAAHGSLEVTQLMLN
jgi:hypothetical protein